MINHSNRKKKYIPLVGHYGTAKFDLVDPRTYTVTSYTPPNSGAGSYNGMVVSKDNNTIFALDGDFYYLRVYRVSAPGTVVSTYTSAKQGFQCLALSPDGNTCAVVGADSYNATIDWVNVKSSLTSTSAPSLIGYTGSMWSGGTAIFDVTYTPDGSKVLLGCGTGLYIVNASTRATITSIGMSNTTQGICVSPDSSTAYVGTAGSGIKVVDLSTNKVTSTITSANASKQVKITPDGKKLVVAKYSDGVIHAIDIASSTTTSISVGAGPMGVSITPDSSTAFVTCYTANKLYIVNLITNTVITNVSLANTPYSVNYISR